MAVAARPAVGRVRTRFMVKQVSVACEERGRLLEDVWQGFAGAMGGAVARLADGHAEQRRRCQHTLYHMLYNFTEDAAAACLADLCAACSHHGVASQTCAMQEQVSAPQRACKPHMHCLHECRPWF